MSEWVSRSLPVWSYLIIIAKTPVDHHQQQPDFQLFINHLHLFLSWVRVAWFDSSLFNPLLYSTGKIFCDVLLPGEVNFCSNTNNWFNITLLVVVTKQSTRHGQACYEDISQNSSLVYSHPFIKIKECHPSPIFWFLLVNNTLGYQSSNFQLISPPTLQYAASQSCLISAASIWSWDTLYSIIIMLNPPGSYLQWAD